MKLKEKMLKLTLICTIFIQLILFSNGIKWESAFDWSYNCIFVGNEIKSFQSTRIKCVAICIHIDACTHFTWMKSGEKGSCFLNSGSIDRDDAISLNDNTTVCGIVLRTQYSILSLPSIESSECKPIFYILLHFKIFILIKVLEIGLAAHNRLRAIHSSPDLVLDSELNKIAQEYAEFLANYNEFKHSTSGYGENLYKICGSNINIQSKLNKIYTLTISGSNRSTGRTVYFFRYDSSS
jgi:hypothetical protein